MSDTVKSANDARGEWLRRRGDLAERVAREYLPLLVEDTRWQRDVRGLSQDAAADEASDNLEAFFRNVDFLIRGAMTERWVLSQGEV